MTQIHLYEAFLILAWSTLVTILFIRDTRKAEAITRDFDSQDVARRAGR